MARTVPAPTDLIRYDLDMLRAATDTMEGPQPSLRQVLQYATSTPDSELYDDAARAEEFAEALEGWHAAVHAPGPLVISVVEAQLLNDAAEAHLAYALDNHYDDPAEAVEDPDAYLFATFGKLLLSVMRHPWTALTIPADGSSGFTLA